MKVLILVEGTRGDIQPCVALAEALAAAGHQPVVVGWSWTPWPDLSNAGSLVRFAPVGEHKVSESARAAAAKITHGGVRGVLARIELARELRPDMVATLDEVWAVAAEGADLVVHLPGTMAGQHIAEKLRVPAVAISFTPIYVPTCDIANPLLPPQMPVPKTLNRATYALTPLLWLPYQKTISAWRMNTLQLPPRRGGYNPLLRPDGQPAPVMGAYSEHAVPVPSDAPQHLHTTGYWFPAEPDPLGQSAELGRFLKGGEPPVYIGFSSTDRSALQLTWRKVIAAIELAQVRAVITTGSAGDLVSNISTDVFVTDGVPHSWLFPQVAAIVHHGGAGTTGAALAAGRPQVICPFSFDQPFWGAQMRRLGVGGVARPLHRHTPESLAAAIRQAAKDEGTRNRAEALGKLISAENGPQTAVRVLESLHRDSMKDLPGLLFRSGHPRKNCCWTSGRCPGSCPSSPPERPSCVQLSP